MALESSGSTSASATALIFPSQTVLFYSLGTHFAVLHSIYGTQTQEKSSKTAAGRLMGPAYDSAMSEDVRIKPHCPCNHPAV